MKMNRWKMTFVAGLLTVLAFINLSCLSWSLFPGEFTPFSHPLSDLGNNLLNPRGAIYYQLALILSGIGLFFFFWGLICWKTEDKKYRKSSSISIGYGIFASIALFINGIYLMLQPVNFPSQTRIQDVSISIFYFFISFAILYTGADLLKHPKMLKWLSMFSIIIGLISIITVIVSPIWLSWLTSFSWLLFVIFFSFRTKKAFGF